MVLLKTLLGMLQNTFIWNMIQIIIKSQAK